MCKDIKTTSKLKQVVCSIIIVLTFIVSPVQAYADAPPESEAEYINAAEDAPALPAPFVTTANLRLRTEPTTNSEIIQTVPQGSTVQVTDLRDGRWKAVEFGGAHGYMYAEFLFDLSGRDNPPAVGASGIERLHWSYVQTFLPQGVPVTITDVRTGITYQMVSFSHGSHADVRPFSAEDTAAFLRTFNGRWSWSPRPILVHIGERTVAASINGVPHGGTTSINNNNMYGHVCIHFYGSRTHNRNTNHERDHQNAVREAFNARA